ncbi:MAG: efflux RND transporter permease subunit [Candidatus Polarisedimenticolaceae bacterium]|nr:efflux RND transporter permease subunit [Candidatus Polarisedimenticolaceae bacterium]
MIDFSIRNPLIVNLALALVVLSGVLSWFAMPQEMFPTIEQDKIQINTTYEGAAPEEVERQITLPIEEEFDGMRDIDTITSTSNEGLSSIMISLKPGSDVDDFMRKARTAVDRVVDLPSEAKEPELSRLETRFPVISVSLYGDVARGYLFDRVEEIKREMMQLPGVASVGISGDQEWELWVEVNPQVLAARNLSLEMVGNALRSNLRDLPGGSVKSQEGDIRLRGLGVAPNPEAVSQIMLRHNRNGGILRLGDVAKVERRLEEVKTIGRFNGKPSVNMTITKTAPASTVEVAQQVRDYVDELQRKLPAGIRIGIFSDLSIFVKNRLETVKSSGLIGLSLVLLALCLMLNLRVAAITAMGIPISFLVAVIIISYLGYTINMVSLFAFLIALGLIVDDAIIVTENIYRHVETGMPPSEAASLGTKEVFWPVMASTMTTIAAFMPMLAVGGTMGAFIAVIPIVVSAALIGSLLEAFGVLPSHAKEWLRAKKQQTRAGWINWGKLLNRYLSTLRWALHNRYHVSLFTIGILLIAIAYAHTRIPFLLFGHVDTGQFFINIETPNTYSIEDSTKVAKQLEQVIFETLQEGELETLLTNVGVSFIDMQRVRLGSRYIQLIIDLKKPKPEGFIERYVSPVVSLKFRREGSRERPTNVITHELRERLQQVPGIQRMSLLRPQGGPSGADIEIGVTGADVEILRAQAERIRSYLQRLPGISDARQDMDPGKLEYRYQLNERGRQLGLTQAQLANAVRTGFLGQKVVYVNWRDKRIPVRLIYPDELRNHAVALERLPITLERGKTVYLGDVATIKRERGFNSVNRRDMQRLATITAEVNATITTPNEVIEQVKEAFKNLPTELPGYQLLFLGSKKEANESFAGMKQALIISLAIIFFILAALFKSLLDPLVVMFAIPFGIIGVLIGHILFGYHLQFLSGIGFLALTGIVVNDSLILIDFAKRLQNQGWNRVDALVEAGRIRIRPILLTSITTFLGISPLIFFATGQTAFLSPMAVSLGFGLLFATGLILLALPCFYLVADDARRWTRRVLRPENPA